MKSLKVNPWFFVPYLVLLLVVGVLLFVLDKGDATLWLNGHNTVFLDHLFRFSTKMGEGTFYAVALLVLLTIRPAYSVYGLLCLIVTSIIVYFLKYVVFKDVVRPVLYFQGKVVLHVADEVTLNRLHSFPSGHTATAFTLFCFAALIVKERRWGAFFLLMGVFAAMSRMYLGQHFLVDVYFGSIIGVLVSFGMYHVIQGQHWFNEHPRFTEPLIKIPRLKKAK